MTTVGIGMPASIQFDTPVATKAMRAQIEKLVKITVSPAQKGSWGWLDSRQLMWRPATLLAARHQGDGRRAADRRPDRGGQVDRP